MEPTGVWRHALMSEGRICLTYQSSSHITLLLHLSYIISSQTPKPHVCSTKLIPRPLSSLGRVFFWSNLTINYRIGIKPKPYVVHFLHS